MGDKNEKTSSFWLYFEIMIVAFNTWRETGKFWKGAFVFFFLILGFSIPIVGHILCFVLGIVIGIQMGILCVFYGTPIWLGWTVGIIMGVLITAKNLSVRKNL